MQLQDDQLFVLVDHSNLYRIWKGRPLYNLIHSIISKVPAQLLTGISRVRVRLYGGWFEGEAVSRDAQAISAEIHRDFPTSIARLDSAAAPLIVNVELAGALLVQPDKQFTHTFVRRGSVGRLLANDLPMSKCIQFDVCPLRSVSEFIISGKCATENCEVGLNDLLVRAEQKIVDTMLAVDAVMLAASAAAAIVVVSDDADILPAIVVSRQLNSTVVHVKTRTNERQSPHKWAMTGSRYVDCNLAEGA